MSGFSRFYPDFTAGQLRYLAGGANSALNDQYLICNGATVSQTTYSDLYAVIGLIKNGNWTSTWTTQTSGTASSIYALIYNGSNLFVYGGTGGVLATSTNAVTWTAQTSGTTSQINSLIYNGSNLYVIAGTGGMLRTSTDAITWTTKTPGTSSAISSLAFGNNLYLYGTITGLLKTSTDTVTWTTRTSGTTQAIRSLAYNGSNLYLFGADTGILKTSTDGITWVTQTSGVTSAINTIIYANNLYVYGTGNGLIGTSTDATTWTVRTTGLASTKSINQLQYTNGVYTAACDDNFIYSTDAITWSIDSIVGGNGGYNALAYKPNNLLVIGGNSGSIRTANFYAYDPATQFALPTAGVAPSVKYPNTPVVYIKYR